MPKAQAEANSESARDQVTVPAAAVTESAHRHPDPAPTADGRRPRAMVLMPSATFTTQFGAEELERLRTVADVPDPIQYSDLTASDTRAVLAETEVLITSWGSPPLDARLLGTAPRLRAVFHAAGSVRRLVTDALWERQVLLTSSAEVNADPVAEFTLASIIMAGKKAPFMAAAARSARGDWSQYRGAFGPLTNLDRTIGIIGYSKIGKRVVQRLQAMAVTVLVHDPVVDPAEIRAAGAQPVPLDHLLRGSDVVSVHAPELPSTHHMLGAEQLALIDDHATLINTARGSLVDTAALERECATGRLNAILDVTDPEPLPADSVLFDLPNVMVTPHVAGSLGNERRRMSRRAITELERFSQGRPPLGAVTREEMAVLA